MESRPNEYIYKTLPNLRPGEHCAIEAGKNCKSRRIREFFVRLCILVVPESTPIKSHQNDYQKVNSTRMIPVNMPSFMWKNSGGVKPTQCTTSNWTKVGVEEVVLTRDGHNSWFASAKLLGLKSHMQVILYGLRRLYLGHYSIYKYIYTYNNNWWSKKPWIGRRVERDIWKGVEEGKGKERYGNKIQKQTNKKLLLFHKKEARKGKKKTAITNHSEHKTNTEGW